MRRRRRLTLIDGRPVDWWGSLPTGRRLVYRLAAFVLGWALAFVLGRTGWAVSVAWLPAAFGAGYWVGLALERKAGRR